MPAVLLGLLLLLRRAHRLPLLLLRLCPLLLQLLLLLLLCDEVHHHLLLLLLLLQLHLLHPLLHLLGVHLLLKPCLCWEPHRDTAVHGGRRWRDDLVPLSEMLDQKTLARSHVRRYRDLVYVVTTGLHQWNAAVHAVGVPSFGRVAF